MTIIIIGIEIIFSISRQPISSIQKLTRNHENEIMFPYGSNMTYLTPSLYCLNWLILNSQCNEGARFVIFFLFWNVREIRCWIFQWWKSRYLLTKEEKCSLSCTKNQYSKWNVGLSFAVKFTITTMNWTKCDLNKWIATIELWKFSTIALLHFEFSYSPFQ